MRIVFTLLLWSLLVAGWAYWAMAWWWARAFFARSNHTRNGHRVCDAAPFLPGVSILKPVKGLDAHVWENFVSFCQQDYRQFEILFGVAEASDPAVKLIRQLQQSFPHVPIRLFIGAGVGANPKAALLSRLEANAHGDVLVISDSDIRVSPDYLQRVVAPLRDPQVGLVTCPYRGMLAESLSARFESLYLDVTFLPAVMVADRLGTILGLGATMALRRSDLAATGGYAALADHLMDDHQIASAMRKRGLRIHLSEYVASSVLGKTGFAEQWSREVRWSRGIRTVCHSGYAGILLTFITPIALASCLTGGITSLVALGASVLLRWMIAWQVTGWLGCAEERPSLLWLPIRDCLSFLVWCTGNFGSHVIWRGRRYRIGHRGSLEFAPPNWGAMRMAVRRLDAFLRRRQHIFDFSNDPRCVLRISPDVCREAIVLADGAAVVPGDAVGEIHFLNDHLPQIPPGGPGIAWANEARRALEHSLRLLARAAVADSRLQHVRAFHGTIILGVRGGRKQIDRTASRLYFQRIDPRMPPGLSTRIHHIFQNILVRMLIWTFNPGGVRGLGLRRQRNSLWISRRTLLGQYGPPPTASNGTDALPSPPGHGLAEQEIEPRPGTSRRNRHRIISAARVGPD